MIALLFDMGVRCNEMIMMEPEDIAFDCFSEIFYKFCNEKSSNQV